MTEHQSETELYKNYAPEFLDLHRDVALITEDLINTYSISDAEEHLADLIYRALEKIPHLELIRHSDSIIARTNWGKKQRIILAGHLDTVPLPTTPNALGTVPATWKETPENSSEQILYGRGATDMKGGVAVQLALAAALSDGQFDITYVFYDHEEVASELSGLAKLMENYRELLTDADFAVLLEPTNGTIEGGCNGTLRFWIHSHGQAAHSARSWVGKNAIHPLGQVLRRLEEYEPQTYEVEGLAYREGLNAVQISGGVAGNMIPDSASVHINYRFAPNKTAQEAIDHMHSVFEGFELDFVDVSSAARPGLDAQMARSLIESVGEEPQPKYGWTDVARFSEIGIPAVNFGPGDALLAHTDNEHVAAEDIRICFQALRDWIQKD